MASKTQKKTATTTSKSNTAKKPAAKKPVQQKRPVRREVGGIVLLVLAL